MDLYSSGCAWQDQGEEVELDVVFKTKINAFSTANHNKGGDNDEPIRTQSRNQQIVSIGFRLRVVPPFRRNPSLESKKAVKKN